MENFIIENGILISCKKDIKGDVVIPDSVTSIGNCVFSNCTNLTSVTIPNSVTSIGCCAFYGCSDITSVTIGNGVTIIGESAFSYCTALTSVIIPNSVKTIKCGVFAGCAALISVTIPDGVTEIGYRAFFNCTNLTSVTIPNGVRNIGFDAFYNCPNLTPNRSSVLPDGRIVAYKAFRWDMTCHGFQYEDGKTYEMDGEIELCCRGFHACLNPFDVFNYYSGEFEKDIVIHEVYLEGVSEERAEDSKVVCCKITIGRRMTLEDMCKIVK